MTEENAAQRSDLKYTSTVSAERTVGEITPGKVVEAYVRTARLHSQSQVHQRELIAKLKAINQNLKLRVADATVLARLQAEHLRASAGELVLAEERERRRLAEPSTKTCNNYS